MKRLFFLPIAIVMLGAGCTSSISSNTTTTLPITGTPSPEGIVTFREGFGKIPGDIPLAGVKSNFSITVRIEGSLPTFPNEVTVLRRRKNLPDSNFLENLTTALSVPSGALRKNPQTQDLAISWKDDTGLAWSYEGKDAKLSFSRVGADTILPVTSAIPNDDLIKQAAKNFLTEKGLFTKGWGEPFLALSWKNWWNGAQLQGQCTDEQAIQIVKQLAQTNSFEYEKLPKLPLRSSGEAACIDPVFPLIATVRFSLSQDEQLAYDKYGNPFVAAEVTLRTDTMEVISGSLEITKDIDRSNYPSMTKQRFIDQLRRGGVGGLADEADQGTIVLKTFNWGIYRHDAIVDGELRTYFIPALQTEGQLTYVDGSSRSITMIVPLLAEDKYQGE